MKTFKQILLAAALLIGGTCATYAQEKTTTAGVPVVKLNNGVEMPRFGIGTFLQPSDEVCEQSCLTALKAGYRHIDTAHAYQDEAGVGRAVKESGIPREEIWITSKLWPTEYGEGKTLKAIDEMLKRMQLNYIDLLYVHQPVGDFVGAWKDMEKAVKMGKVRAFGISNFDANDEVWNTIMKEATIKPAVLQMECHPYAQRVEMRKKAAAEGIQVECWFPLGAGTGHPALAHPGGLLRHPRCIESRLHQGEHPNLRLPVDRRRDAADALAQQGEAFLQRHAGRCGEDGVGSKVVSNACRPNFRRHGNKIPYRGK